METIHYWLAVSVIINILFYFGEKTNNKLIKEQRKNIGLLRQLIKDLKSKSDDYFMAGTASLKALELPLREHAELKEGSRVSEIIIWLHDRKWVFSWDKEKDHIDMKVDEAMSDEIEESAVDTTVN